MNALSGIRYGAELTGAAERYNLDPKLLAAVAAQETGGPGQTSGNNIVGDSGHGHGLMQIDDRWHSFASTPAAMDPQANANYAAGLLSNLLQQYGGNVREALSAYNSGSPTATGTTTDWGNGIQLGYADSVLQHYQQIANMEAGTPTASGGLDPATAIEALGNGSLATGGTSALSGLTGLLGDAGTSSATAGQAASSSGSSSNSNAAALISQMAQDGQQSPSSTPPFISWNQISNASSQVSGQADQLMAALGDPADGSSGSSDS